MIRLMIMFSILEPPLDYHASGTDRTTIRASNVRESNPVLDF